MPNIRKLPIHEAQKIAAGEVVERPANIVKELVENSIDAGATQIIIHVQQAGKKSIRIQDNGCGMDQEDAQLCFKHHATSKIKHVEDLHSISTFGFRGEALSSIASVSHVTLITKQSSASEGIQLILDNGTIIQQSTVPATTGTDITIEQLFDTMPARKKFLKSKETEWRHIQQLFFAFVLDYTHISFKLYSENKLLFNCPATDSITNRWQHILDQEVSTHLIKLQSPVEHEDFKLTGVVSSQQYGRYDRNGIYFFVNNRWIKDYKLNRALINGYLNALPTHQFPIACIKVEINPAWIDVNIHPRKEEVQFLYPQKIYNAIKQAVSYTLEEHISDTFGHNTATIAPSDIHTNAIEPTTVTPPQKAQTFVPFNFDTFFNEPFDAHSTTTKAHQEVSVPTLITTPQEKNTPITHTTTPYTIIGTFNKTYILLEQDNELIMIDQHAAHERVLYEQFKNTRTPTTIQLLFPQTISYAKDIILLLTPHLKTLCIYGIEAELFSETQIAIKATPVQLKNASIEAILHTCIATLHQEKNNPEEIIAEQFKNTLHADMACKAAVKAGDTLTQEQITKLIIDTHKTPNRFSCPHGRPTMWHLPLDVIKKKFKRDYR